MSQNPEKVKKLVAFKEKLAKRIEELESEVKDLQEVLETVNSILLEKGFKRLEITKEPAAAEKRPKEEPQVELELPISTSETISENVIPLRTSTGEMLAILHVTEDTLRALPAEDKNFNINTPPFAHFLIERVLTKMQERDSELARTGQLPADKIFSYTILKEGDIIQEIIINNIDQDRLRELKSSIRWTLEKMYEKTKTES